MKKQVMKHSAVPVEIIQNKIYLIRGQKVMLDRDLAELYGVKTYRLNEQVKRNVRRFPHDFVYQLNDEERSELIANCDQLASLKHSSSNPYAFTEQGVAMLSSVLNSDRAIEVNIQIMRVFTKLRQMIESHKDLRHKVEEMEKKYDCKLESVWSAIRQLMTYPDDAYKRTKVGFKVK